MLWSPGSDLNRALPDPTSGGLEASQNLTLPGALGLAVAVTLVTVSGAAFTPLAMTPPYQQSRMLA